MRARAACEVGVLQPALLSRGKPDERRRAIKIFQDSVWKLTTQTGCDCGTARTRIMRMKVAVLAVAVFIVGTMPCVVAQNAATPSPSPAPSPGLTNCTLVNATLADLAHCLPTLPKGDGHATDRGRQAFLTIVGLCLAIGIALIGYKRYFADLFEPEREAGNYSRARGDTFDEEIDVEGGGRPSSRSRGSEGIAMSRMRAE